MVVPDGVQDLRGYAGGSEQGLVPDRRVGFDQGSLLLVEASRLVEHRKRDLGLADVMKHRRGTQALHVDPRQP